MRPYCEHNFGAFIERLHTLLFWSPFDVLKNVLKIFNSEGKKNNRKGRAGPPNISPE